MLRRKCILVLVALTLTLATAVPGQAGVEQEQLDNIHELAEFIFGMQPEFTPLSPCSCTPCNNPSCTCTHLSTGSPNQKLLGRVWYYGWVMKNNRPDTEKNCARTWLADWHIDAQLTHGHYTIHPNQPDEVLTTSHGQLWLGGMAAAYLFALNSGQPIGNLGGPYSSDNKILTAARRWWRDEEYLWEILDIDDGPNYVVDAPGARFNSSASTATQFWLRNGIMRQLNGLRPVPPLPSDWQEFEGYTGGWILEELYNRQHNPTNLLNPVTGHTPSVRLWDTLCVYRNGGEWLYYFPKMRKVTNPIFWVQNRAGQIHNPAYVPGVPVDPPVKPAPFPGAMTEPYPGRGAGAEACPQPTAF